jgi:predicted Zn finger-like uncharacterized protein
MAEIIICPSCQRSLQVPEEHLGRRVQCPECQHRFTATAASAQPPSAPAGEFTPAEQASKSRRRDRDDDEEDDDRERRRRDEYDDVEDDDYDNYGRIRRRPYEPHRGGLVLTLGLVALIGGWAACLPAIIGPIAWYLAVVDLRAIRAGHMDPAGESTTRAGMVCAIIATIGMILGAVAVIAILLLDRR